MKISFLITSVNSKARYHPGIASLSAVLKQAGHNTDLLDINKLDYQLIETYIKAAKPDIIAASTNTHQYFYIKDIIEFVAEKFQHIKIIIGGIHPTLEDNLLNEIKGLDAVCKSEGEKPLLDYVQSIENGGNLLNIPNIQFKRESGIIRNNIEYYVPDLNKLPFPDYSIFPAYKVKDLHFPMRFLFNRGCPFNCTYCCNHILKKNYPPGKYVRFKKPQRVIEELIHFSELYNFDHFVIDDDVFTLNKKWLLEFCNLYPERLKSKTFEINVRVGTVDREMLRALKDIGCSLVKIGLESGNEKIREEVLGRKIRQADIIATADMIKQEGIKVHTFNMVGVPNETRKNVWETIILNRRIKPDRTQLTVFYPYPYTKLGEYCIKNNLVYKRFDDSYFSRTILKRNALGLSVFEINHFVNFFKVYVYFGWNKAKIKTEINHLLKKSKLFKIFSKEFWIKHLKPV
jgi:radical SAM superfamily enzyme YgiQ (UPF0313 family)